jgi:hypothetical protein
MKYLFLLQTAEDGLLGAGTAEAAQMYADYRVAIEAMTTADLDEALKYAAPLPAASSGSVEIRPVVTVQAPVPGTAAEL